MKPDRIARLGAVVLVIAAVAVVLRLKQSDSVSSTGEPAGSNSSVVLAEQPGTSTPVPGPATAPTVAPATAAVAAEAALPRLLDLGADKCIPCKKMAPILEALREDYAGRFEVVFIDVWKDRRAAGAHGINLIPTQIFFDAEGVELFRHEGFFSREDILATWSELGHVFEAPSVDESG